jgi:N-dimethylarginine dimethylaminohydrolase
MLRETKDKLYTAGENGCVAVFVRGVPDMFAHGILAAGVARDAINVDRARTQHAAYVAALRSLPEVKEVVELKVLHNLADSVFVEDSVVFLDANTAIVPSSSVKSRAAEAGYMRTDLEANGISVVPYDGILDGGDVLRMNDNIVICGLSTRTNDAGKFQMLWVR